jgi:hypothetical protein
MLARSRFVVPFLFLAACSHSADSTVDATSLDAVAAGRADARDAAVVAVRVGTRLCTGVAVGARAVLTSRGCATGDLPDDCIHPVERPRLGRDGDAIAIVTGEDVAAGTIVAHGVAVRFPDSPRVCGADLALIDLDVDLPGSIKPPAMSLDPAVLGAAVRVVGYGARKTGGPAGIKSSRRGLSIAGLSTTEASVPTSACAGDEGAPMFDEKSGRVVGVASRWTGDCGAPNEHGVFTRTDAFASFLVPPVPGSGGAGGAAGRACSSAHHCPKGNHCNKTTHVCEPVTP